MATWIEFWRIYDPENRGIVRKIQIEASEREIGREWGIKWEFVVVELYLRFINLTWQHIILTSYWVDATYLNVKEIRILLQWVMRFSFNSSCIRTQLLIHFQIQIKLILFDRIIKLQLPQWRERARDRISEIWFCFPTTQQGPKYLARNLLERQISLYRTDALREHPQVQSLRVFYCYLESFSQVWIDR